MADISARKLGKLSLAILENFVKSKLGEDFIDELRGEYDIVQALQITEERFIKEFGDQDLAKSIFVDLEQKDRPVLKDAVGKFYDHPTTPDFPAVLKEVLLSEFKKISPERADSAIRFYVDLLTEELALVDETFRENVRALADLKGERAQQEMVRILRQVENALSQSSGTITTTSPRIYQLPQPPADFTGRETQIQDILADFEKGGGAALSGLTGLGGIGKTALGLVVAHQLTGKYPDAQIYLDLKGTTAPLSAMDIVRHVILSFEPTADLRALDEQTMQGAYQSMLHGKRALLFFDNARSAEQIAPLRPPEDCAMLVTSRWTFPVAGLTSHKLGVLTEQEAQDFLRTLCPRAHSHTAKLARACGNLPLALRIAGSFLQVNSNWKVETYLAQLTDTRQRLETLHASREQADLLGEPDLLATFELSYDQLKDEDKKRWRALGVFTASFAADAAVSLWEMDETEAAQSLGLFMRYSLLDYNETTARYEMHDLLAEYAHGCMEAGEERTVHIRHARHFMEVMRTADQLYLAGNENILPGLRLFDGEWDHIRAAQAWLAREVEDPEIAELTMRFPSAGTYCLDLRLPPGQKTDWLQNAVESARTIRDRQYESVHLGNLGAAYYYLGEARKAIEFYEQALVVAREIGDRRNEGSWLGNLGLAYADLGEVRKAIEFYEQQLIIVREIGDRRGEGNALGNLGLAYAALGEARKAIEFYEQALVVAREIGDRRGEGNALGNLGLAYAALGEVRKAIDFYEQQLVIAREIGDRRGEGNALANMGNTLYGLGEKERGIQLVKQALVIFEAIESPYQEQARDQLKEWGALE